MSASLMVLIPIVLVGLVGTLCFVGCVFPTSGLPFPQGPYQGAIINNDPNCVGFWPLNEESAAQGALDAISNPGPFNGSYLAGPMGGSIPSPGQPGIVPGDVPDGASTPNTCASFTNGMVSVGFAQALNPSSFTLECWVQPNWTSGDPQATRAVLASANLAAGTGYALFATLDNSTMQFFWEIQIGMGGNGNFFPLRSAQPIALNLVNYLAVTFDFNSNTLKLFVGTVNAGGAGGTLAPPVSIPPNGTFAPETAASLFIGMGRPDAGGMFPFNGTIQDVAIYKAALDGPTTITDHFNTGAGS